MGLAAIPSPPANGVYVGPLLLHACGVIYAIAVLCSCTPTA
jgi:hypothetical protein